MVEPESQGEATCESQLLQGLGTAPYLPWLWGQHCTFSGLPLCPPPALAVIFVPPLQSAFPHLEKLDLVAVEMSLTSERLLMKDESSVCLAELSSCQGVLTGCEERKPLISSRDHWVKKARLLF